MRTQPIHRRLPHPALPFAESQAGVVLFWALIALVALSIAAVALVRSVDTATLVSGNLAFRQSATLSGDRAFAAAIAFLNANAGTATLNGDSPANGYYATNQTGLDITGKQTPNASDDVDWDGTNAAALTKARLVNNGAPDSAGNVVAYVINRLCASPGSINDPANQCLTYSTPNSPGSTKDAASYGATPLSGSTQAYYRITARIAGPRATVSYVQAVVVM